jgi:NAD(P) transhydrogenase subunit alpha
MKFQGLTIGVPKEIMQGERRVATVPEIVKKMTTAGAKVLVEKNAGEGSYFSDDAFAEAGAVILDGAQDIFARADVIIKVKEPLYNETAQKHEADMLRDGQCLIAFLHPAAPVNRDMLKKLAAGGCISLTLDGIPRISRAQPMDALTSMSAVAGYKAVLMAADGLSKFLPMTGTAVGIIKPANTVVIGAGVAGLQAIATAKRLGSVVTAVDIRPDANEEARSLGAKSFDTGIPAEIAVGEGGYAQRLPDEWLVKERESIRGLVKDADVLILSALIPGKLAPILITEEMVRSMAPGSVIVDISIDQGGNCEITEAGRIVVKHGVTINGIKNLPGMLPTSSTWMFANNVYNMLDFLVQDGKIVLNREDPIIASTLTTIDKTVVHAGAIESGL